MQLKIGEKTFEATPELLQTMVDMVAQTKKDGKEHGFLMCESAAGLVPGDKCTGNQCSINITDCKGKPVAGSFHTHPTVISFSLNDYLSGFDKAKQAGTAEYLLCVSLLDKGIRCKALKEMPPAPKIPPWGTPDTETNRQKVKPYWTKRVNISLEQVSKLIAGVPWDDLPEAKAVIAVDEGEDLCVSGDKECLSEPGELPWPEKPTGVYPWSNKPQFKSVKTPFGVAMEPIPQAKILSKETEFIDITSIETPDSELIHMGEVGQYVNALAPVQLLKKKDKSGKWVIHDGRHRLVAWSNMGRPFWIAVSILGILSLPIWRGAGHSRQEGISFWRLAYDSTHEIPNSPFGHQHLSYDDAVTQARAAYQEYCSENL
jgi:hypothetical protein